MARGWTCGRCSTANGEAAITCSGCGLIRGGVVPEGSHAPPAMMPAEADRVPAEADRVPTGALWGAGAGGSVEQPTSTESGLDAPPVARPLWRRIPIGWLILAVIVVGGGVAGWYFGAGRSSSGEITRAGDLTASELQVGDCFDLKDPAADEVGDVTARPCTDEHEYEMFFVGSLPEGAYPADDAFATFVSGNCVEAFESFVGKGYADSELDIFWLKPLNEGWEAGDRSIQCAVYHPRIHRLTESLKGSNR